MNHSSRGTPKQKVHSPDIQVENHGSIVLLVPETDAGRAWVKENIGPDNGYQPYFPQAVIVEPRYVAAIVEGMQNDRLVVR